ncbi:tyrosine-type recombinase/integrase [Herbaspirillum huttiense]|uniref:Site-specific integrase n=2 Tax=Herbaspirillum huttiense TaxID=863372 RepID=A0AAJ2H5N6_9BURK|nr:site-specific integrase [Herbaspirillum huttiense]MDR9834070.1 site-specific integrase [Herbaspirillum huttiense]
MQCKTWDDAAERWLNEQSHKASIHSDKSILRWLSFYLSGLMLNDINREVIDSVHQEKRATGVANATVNRTMALLRSILLRAHYDWEWTESIPKIRLLPEPDRRIRFLTRQQAIRLLHELPEHLADMAAFSLATGLRKSNVTHLEWSQIHLPGRLAWIHPDQSKARKAIAVPLNGDALRILSKRLGSHSRYVFTYKGCRIEKVSTAAWYKALKRAGISNFRWHDLRHTWASWHVQNGTPLYVVQELGGWKSYEMVRKYAHFSAGHLASFANTVDGLITA